MPNAWDQQNRLVKALLGTHESDYFYDGESRRGRVKELESGTQTKDETFVWCGPRICQKRSGTTVERNYFEQGFEEGTSDYFYTRDHLGSVREVVASDGTAVASRASYDPWGKSTVTGSGAFADFGFTGHYFDRPTGLGLTKYRAFSPVLGRWLTRDPIGLKGGRNLYAYVGNAAVGRTDSTGLIQDHDLSPRIPADPPTPNFCKWRCDDDLASAEQLCVSQQEYYFDDALNFPGDRCYQPENPLLGSFDPPCETDAKFKYDVCLARCDGQPPIGPIPFPKQHYDPVNPTVSN